MFFPKLRELDSADDQRKSNNINNILKKLLIAANFPPLRKGIRISCLKQIKSDVEN